MFLDTLKYSVFEKCGWKVKQPLLVGVSGGADSLVLMFGLKDLGFQLTIAHLDHGLREESAQDADALQALAAAQGLDFIRKRVDVGKVAQTEGQSTEEAARNVRYQFLFEQARACGAQAVAVGHHADDQVETVLMHFLRGSALPGLTGMDYRKIMPIWDDNIPLIRPLLGIWRDEIESYLDELGVVPRIDHTNWDTTYFRNRLRHELIPELQTYNPQIREGIWRMADILREEDQYLDQLTQTAWQEIKVRLNQERIILDSSKFTKQPKAIQRRLLRYAIAHLRPDLRDVGYDAIERGLAMANDPSKSGELDLVARLNLAILDDYLIIKTWESSLPDWEMPLLKNAQEQQSLTPGTAVNLQHGWQLQAKLLTDTPADILVKAKELKPKEAWLDEDLLTMPLTLRGRQEGERWQPLGMQGHSQKINDFFINEKIPEHVRERWPLVCSGDEIAWVAGLRPSEAFKVSQQTKRILHLRLVRKVV